MKRFLTDGLKAMLLAIIIIIGCICICKRCKASLEEADRDQRILNHSEIKAD